MAKSLLLSFFILFACLLATAQARQPLPPLPFQPHIGGKVYDSISVKKLLEAGKLECPNPHFQVTSFRMGFTNALGCYSEYVNEADTFSTTTRRVIGYFTPGTRIWFDSVTVKNSTGRQFVLKNTALRISR